MVEKSPFSDEVSDLTDPNSLVTGSGSQMFSNERLKGQNRRAEELKRKRAEQSSQLIPVANDLLEMLAEKKSQNADIRSYLTRMRGSGEVTTETEKEGRRKTTTKQPEIKQLTAKQIQQLAVQAEAREMNIALIEEIERWIRNRLRQNQ